MGHSIATPLIMKPRRVITLLTAGVLACVLPGRVSATDIEVEVALATLADELNAVPQQDSVLLLNRLGTPHERGSGRRRLGRVPTSVRFTITRVSGPLAPLLVR
jgi:hypothetical protein